MSGSEHTWGKPSPSLREQTPVDNRSVTKLPSGLFQKACCTLPGNTPTIKLQTVTTPRWCTLLLPHSCSQGSPRKYIACTLSQALLSGKTDQDSRRVGPRPEHRPHPGRTASPRPRYHPDSWAHRSSRKPPCSTLEAMESQWKAAVLGRVNRCSLFTF